MPREKNNFVLPLFRKKKKKRKEEEKTPTPSFLKRNAILSEWVVFNRKIIKAFLQGFFCNSIKKVPCKEDETTSF